MEPGAMIPSGKYLDCRENWKINRRGRFMSRNDRGDQRCLAVPLLVFVLAPALAWADVGTRLDGATFLFLLLGNCLIGSLEGALLAIIYRVPPARAATLLIVANYFSAFAGGSLVTGPIYRALNPNLNTVWPVFWGLVAISYAVTLAFEFPFVLFALWRSQKRFRKSVVGSFVIQSVSYVLLCGWFWMAGTPSPFTEMQIAPISEMTVPENVLFCFISPDDGAVYVRSLTNPTRMKYSDLNPRYQETSLHVSPSYYFPGEWALVVSLSIDGSHYQNVVKEAFSSSVVPFSTYPSRDEDLQIRGSADVSRRTAAADQSVVNPWAFLTREEFLAKRGGRLAGFAYQTMLGGFFNSWPARNASLLPTDKILFQLGDDQICLYDPETNRVALVERGRGPVAFIESDLTGESMKSMAAGTSAVQR
ncbi:hypothetical protein JW916_15145 [Candidatus Sumerlaeota bacterium]|nr:hypothetical protein [Candidatus Sumerlaeota bacterium]